MILTEFNDEIYRKMVKNDYLNESKLNIAKSMKYMLNEDGTHRFTNEDILLATGISKEELGQL